MSLIEHNDDSEYVVRKIDWFTGYIRYKLNKNQSILALWVGDTGTGKSYSSISAALRVDKDFNIDRIVFDTKSFMNLINSGLPKGSVVIYDDAGIGISNKDWYKEQVKVFGKVVQTFRSKQIITFITTPDMSFIENQSRSLLNLLMQSDPVKQGLFYPKVPYKPRNYSFHHYNIYYAYPRYTVLTASGKEIKVMVKNIQFPMPTDYIVEQYEQKKQEHMDKYYESAEEMLKSEGKEKRGMNPNSLLNLKGYKRSVGRPPGSPNKPKD